MNLKSICYPLNGIYHSIVDSLGVKKPNLKVAVSILLFIVLLNQISIFPAATVNAQSDFQTSDYGIFTQLDNLHETKASRMADSDVNNETRGRLDEMVLLLLWRWQRENIISPSSNKEYGSCCNIAC